MSTATFAQAATPVAGSILPPNATVDGLGLDAWHARFWQWDVGLSVDPNAAVTGAACDLGQHGPVFFLASAATSVERACVVPTDVTLFVPVFNDECSTVEAVPFYGRDEAKLRACASINITSNLAQAKPVLAVTVDGQTLTDFSSYRAPTPLFQMVRPPSSDNGNHAQIAQSVGDGYVVMIAPLSEGEHVVTVSTPGNNGAVAKITYRLTVSSGAVAAS